MPPRSPRVSVVMPVRNGESYLRSAVTSVLEQSMPDFELIVVDDCSDDATPEILSSFKDRRMAIIRTDSPSGSGGAARNLGVDRARGEYLAGADADDVSFPRRLEHLTALLDARLDLVAASSPMAVIDEAGARRGLVEKPRGSLALRWSLIFYPPLSHPSLMFRRAALSDEPAYDNSRLATEDYDLFVRLLSRGEGENVAFPLVFYRRHPRQMTQTLRKRQLREHDEVARRALAQELPEATIDPELFGLLWRHVVGLRPPGDVEELVHAYLDLLVAFADRHAQHPQLARVRRHAVAEIARRSLHRVSARGRGRLARRLLALDASSVATAPAILARAATRRARWSLGRRVR